LTDHRDVYNQYADNYERLVVREDYQHHIIPALQKIAPLTGKDIIETGAGTGRLTCMLAPLANSIRAYDISEHMLSVAASKMKNNGWMNWETGITDHRSLPAPDASADICISGWSVCYLVDWSNGDWQSDVEKALAEMQRVLKPGGVIILLETQGTGFETPHPPDHLKEYYHFLEDHGFSSTWIRTDYDFDSLQEAKELTQFFFGDELASQLTGRVLPECTGIWWR